MARDILVIWTKNRLKTDKAIESAQKIEEHLGNVCKVLVLDKNVDSVEWFDMPKEEVINNELAIDLEIQKLETEGEKE